MVQTASPITICKTEWLTDPKAVPAVHTQSDDYQKLVVPMSRDIGKGWLEILTLNLGMVLSRGIHLFRPNQNQLVPLAEIKADLSEPILVLQSARTGQVVLKEHRVGAELTFGNEQVLFQHVDNLHFTPLLDTCKDIEVTVLKISNSDLVHLLGESTGRSLLRHLDIETIPSARTVHVPPSISSILYSALNSDLDKDVGKLYAQAKVLEYLCALASYMDIDKAKTRSSHRDQLAEQLFEELMRTEGKIPRLDELATRYDTSAKTLNDAFKHRFGQAIYSFVLEHRLNEAHAALQNSDIAMKVLANRLGYSHVNHFVNAFSKKFGYSPGSLRRG